MKWHPITNVYSILRHGDIYRIRRADHSWGSWGRVKCCVGLTLQDFVAVAAPREPWHNGNPESMVEVRRPVIEEGV